MSIPPCSEWRNSFNHLSAYALCKMNWIPAAGVVMNTNMMMTSPLRMVFFNVCVKSLMCMLSQTMFSGVLKIFALKDTFLG